ncbi:hypothetical protein K435DRAFT_784998 [Dendrothele bispora CBS 962.96]|uniref:DEAD/DEAH-box helicase domain-containing protein n=1 Tax=Dendrothele bispora (strain CBS 962.96) TaxID=1314807 RepID=A0A4S8KZJ7_DENBC|nr:hypothetical protein K435DRAFT_784998 [Dendrothele bispora CBS 962.96]
MPVISRFFESERLEMAKEKLCQAFGIAALREHQIKAGENTMSGINTLYDIPTGGSKTLAFWLPLFYHWEPGNTSRQSEKVVVVISSLNALMDTQAKDLNNRGIPAIALNSENGKPKDLFKVRVVSLVIDEAHCVSEWGNDDSHPDYAEVGVPHIWFWNCLLCTPSAFPLLLCSHSLQFIGDRA